jgi:NAD-dependent deacetylase
VDASSTSTLPRCARCDGLLRPDVVWFGEPLDGDVLAAAFTAAVEADVCLVVGTSALVYPAASVPEATSRAGGVVVEVNLQPTPLTATAGVTLFGEAGKLVPALLVQPS